MVTVAAVLSAVLAGWLVLVQPWRGRQRYHRLIERLAHDPSARLEHYRRGHPLRWVAAALVGPLPPFAPTPPRGPGAPRAATPGRRPNPAPVGGRPAGTPPSPPPGPARRAR